MRELRRGLAATGAAAAGRQRELVSISIRFVLHRKAVARQIWVGWQPLRATELCPGGWVLEQGASLPGGCLTTKQKHKLTKKVATFGDGGQHQRDANWLSGVSFLESSIGLHRRASRAQCWRRVRISDDRKRKALRRNLPLQACVMPAETFQMQC